MSWFTKPKGIRNGDLILSLDEDTNRATFSAFRALALDDRKSARDHQAIYGLGRDIMKW